MEREKWQICKYAQYVSVYPIILRLFILDAQLGDLWTRDRPPSLAGMDWPGFGPCIFHVLALWPLKARHDPCCRRHASVRCFLARAPFVRPTGCPPARCSLTPSFFLRIYFFLTSTSVLACLCDTSLAASSDQVLHMSVLHWCFPEKIYTVPVSSSSSAALRLASRTTVGGNSAISATWIPKLWSQTPSLTL